MKRFDKSEFTKGLLPGSILLKLTRILYSQKKQKEIFEPIITDWWIEYLDALDEKNVWKARWINVRYIFAFLTIGRPKISLLYNSPFSYKLLKITDFLYSPETQKEVFEALVGDWQQRYLEALSKNKINKARWINIQQTYKFILVMIQMSPIGDFIELVKKIAK